MFYHTFISEVDHQQPNLVSNRLPFEGESHNCITALFQECYFSNTSLWGYFRHQSPSEEGPASYRIKLIPQHSGEPRPHEILAIIDRIDAEEAAAINNHIVSKWNRLNMLDVALIEFDENENMTLVNVAWENYIGRPYWHFFSIPFIHHIHPDDRTLWNTALKQTSTSSIDASTFKIRLLHPNGKTISMDCKPKHYTDWDKGLQKSFMFSSTQKPESINSDADLLNIAIENTNESIAILNANRQFLYLNKAHVKLYGYQSELELIGKKWDVLYDADEKQRIEQEILPDFEHNDAVRFESRGIKKDGTFVFQRVCLTRLPNGEIFCTKKDITENKEQVNRLNELALIAKLTTMMVLVTDKHGLVTWANKSFTQKTDWQVKEILGQSILKFLGSNTNLFDEAQNIALSIEKGSVFNGEHRMVNKKNGIIWVESNLTPVHNASGEIHQFILIQNDINLRKQAENDILQSFQKEQELNRLKNQFIQLTSHEFRTPMASIYTSMDVMKHYLENEDSINFKRVFERHYTNVIKEISRLEKTMNHILILGRHDSEKTNFKAETTDLIKLIKTIIHEDLLAHEGRKVKLTFKGKPRMIGLDSNCMHFIITNLLDNAFKFGRPNEVPRVCLWFKKNAVSLSVEDSGIGIPSEEIHRLFDSFYRASNADCIGGTGLGLVVVKKLTELHGGKVDVKSELNQGSLFTITLPNCTHEE